jgi:hypothetical protein
LNLQQAISGEAKRILAFKNWYLKMNIKYPNEFPLEIPDDNSGVWLEMIAEFDTEDPQVIETLSWK